MFDVILSKIDGGDAVRTSGVRGTCPFEPSIGRSFQMYAEPLTEGAFVRMIWTSPVREIIKNGETTVIITDNSTYGLEFQKK